MLHLRRDVGLVFLLLTLNKFHTFLVFVLLTLSIHFFVGPIKYFSVLLCLTLGIYAASYQ